MTTILQITGLCFFVFTFAYFIYITRKHSGEIWGAMLGDDGKLQLTELAALFWFILFPILFFADLFLGLKASEEIWYSMDGIFLIIIGGHSVNKHFESRQKKNGGDTTQRS